MLNTKKTAKKSGKKTAKKSGKKTAKKSGKKTTKKSTKQTTKKRSSEGGKNAISGFAIQSISALLDALEDSIFLSITIEPYLDDGNCEKVDYLIVRSDGTSQAVQVKSSKNKVNKPDVKRWAAELRASKSATGYRLVLFAPITGSLARDFESDGVAIRCNTGDPTHAWHAVAHRAHEFVERNMGAYSPLAVRNACYTFVGETIVQATFQRTWTSEEFMQAFARHVKSHSQSDSHVPGVEVQLRRLVLCRENGRCHDCLRYTLTNRTGTFAAFFVNALWTDTDHVEVRDVFDCHGAIEGVEMKSQPSGVSRLEVPFSLDVGESRSLYINAEKDHAVQRLGSDMWHYSDPLIRYPYRYEAEIIIVFPSDGQISATGAAEKDSRYVRWTLVVGPETLPVVATSTKTLSAPQEQKASLRGNVTNALSEHWPDD